jgi:hypothetical protein
MLYGKRQGLGKGVPMNQIARFIAGVDRAVIPKIAIKLKHYHFIVIENQVEDGEYVCRISGLMLERWLSRMREERGRLTAEMYHGRLARTGRIPCAA